MPYVSDHIVSWANGVLRDGSAAARKAMLTSQPVLPPSGGITMAAVGHAGADPDTVLTLNYSKLKIGAAADSIAFIKLRPNAKNEIGAMTFAMKRPADLPTVASRAGWTPVWWLPWQSKHIVKIKIRSRLTDPTIAFGAGVAPVDNPGIFFTAAINGCSVFAVGDSKSPSMYHGGSDGTMTARGPGELTEDAWRRLIGRVGTAKNVQGIGKSDYISELNPTRADDDDRTTNSTTASRDFEQRLLQRGNLTNLSVEPWGMVFGVRDVANDWTMTLVKNSLVKCQRINITRKKRTFRSDKIVTTHVGETRNDRFYNADGVLYNEMATAEQPICNCFTLGWQDFFPGVGAAQMYDMTTANVF